MLRSAAHHAKQALTVPRYYGQGLLKVFTTDPVFLWAQAIAFKTLVTLLPLILLAVGIFGQVLRKEDSFTTVAEFLRGFLPRAQSDGLVELLLQLQQASGELTLVGGVFFLVTVVTMFSTLRYVVGSAMGESRHQMRTLVGGYLFDLRMAAQVGSLFLLSFVITAGARVLSARSGSFATQLGLDAGLVTAAASGLLHTVTVLIPYVLTVGMLAQLYHFVPRPRASVRSALAGAGAAALLFELAKNGFAYYATYVADFDRYAEQGEGLGGLGGVFGLILAFVFWVYVSGLILVVGAVVVALHERRAQPAEVADPQAVGAQAGGVPPPPRADRGRGRRARRERRPARPDARPDARGGRTRRRRGGVRRESSGRTGPRTLVSHARRLACGLLPGRPRVTARLFALVLALAALGPARAQAPLTLVNDSTTVRSVAFDVSDGESLLVSNLELQVATTAPPPSYLFGLVGGDDGGAYPLIPVELAKDAVRLQRYYVESGFPLAAVDYAVALDTTSNTGAVTFEITEGPPLLIDRVTFAGPGQSDVAAVLAPEIRDDWDQFTRRTNVRPGDRLDAFALVRLQSETIGWLRNRGYAWADAGAEQFPDSTGLRAGVRVKVNVGTRARIGRVVVEGDTSLSAGVISREIPVQSGDLFNASALVEGQREVFGLGLFSLALVDLDPSAARGDSTVNVIARVRRGPSRVLNAFGGYFSDGGVTVRSSATHRNAFEGARQLSLNLEARTGIGGISGRSVSGGPITDYRASVSFRQPYVFDRRLSYTLQPSYRVRDDEIESSTQLELANTLLLTRAPLQTVALSLAGRVRDLSRGLGLRLLDAGQFALPPGPFLPDTLESTTGGLGLDIVFGKLDDPLQPTRGFVLRPSLALAAGDVNFGRGRLAASVTVPLRRRVGVVARVTVGGLAPFRNTSPDAVADYVLFRDQLFYAGGTSDVRGWATTLLGPKTFSVTPPVQTPGVVPDPSKVTSPTDVGYIGIGGRYKASASVQLNLPLALGPQWGANLFVDAGQVAAPSTAPTLALLRAGGSPADATLADQLEKEGGVRVGAGAGIQYLTPVGFVSIALGVKANPSYLDRRAAAQVYCGSSIDDGVCFSGGTPAGGVPLDGSGRPVEGADIPGYVDAKLSGTDFDPDLIPTGGLLGSLFRRTQIHIAIGQTF